MASFGCLAFVLLNLADYSQTKADRAGEDGRLNRPGGGSNSTHIVKTLPPGEATNANT